MEWNCSLQYPCRALPEKAKMYAQLGQVIVRPLIQVIALSHLAAVGPTRRMRGITWRQSGGIGVSLRTPWGKGESDLVDDVGTQFLADRCGENDAGSSVSMRFGNGGAGDVGRGRRPRRHGGVGGDNGGGGTRLHLRRLCATDRHGGHRWEHGDHRLHRPAGAPSLSPLGDEPPHRHRPQGGGPAVRRGHAVSGAPRIRPGRPARDQPGFAGGRRLGPERQPERELHGALDPAHRPQRQLPTECLRVQCRLDRLRPGHGGPHDTEARGGR